MRLNRVGVAALVGSAVLVVGGGVALAGNGSGDRSARCEARLAKIAERRGVTVEQLKADIQARLLARVDAALAAGRITSERAAKLRQRIADASFCPGHRRHVVGIRALLSAAADYLDLSKAALRMQLPGTSLATLAEKQGKSVEGLKAAMLAPAEERLEKAVEAKRVTQTQADERLEKLEQRVDRLIAKTFPAKP